jgi:thioester reductase-like protein/acyl-CoA synthetase (AMP-forming)/AMP-acid ligase II
METRKRLYTYGAINVSNSYGITEVGGVLTNGYEVSGVEVKLHRLRSMQGGAQCLLVQPVSDSSRAEEEQQQQQPQQEQQEQQQQEHGVVEMGEIWVRKLLDEKGSGVTGGTGHSPSKDKHQRRWRSAGNTNNKQTAIQKQTSGRRRFFGGYLGPPDEKQQQQQPQRHLQHADGEGRGQEAETTGGQEEAGATDSDEEAERGGWYRTGDIGRFVGTLRPGSNHRQRKIEVIDRISAFFKLAQGEFVSPEGLESVYAQSELVTDVFVTGRILAEQVVVVVLVDHAAIERARVGATAGRAVGRAVQREEQEAGGAVVVTGGEGAAAVALSAELVLADLRRLGSLAGLQPYEIPLAVHLANQRQQGQHPHRHHQQQGVCWNAENGLLTGSGKKARAALKRCYSADVTRMYREHGFDTGEAVVPEGADGGSGREDGGAGAGGSNGSGASKLNDMSLETQLVAYLCHGDSGSDSGGVTAPPVWDDQLFLHEMGADSVAMVRMQRLVQRQFCLKQPPPMEVLGMAVGSMRLRIRELVLQGKAGKCLNTTTGEKRDEAKYWLGQAALRIRSDSSHAKNGAKRTDGGRDPKREPHRLSFGSHILLTGATGFIGPFLLHQLLLAHPTSTKVYCIVRCCKVSEGRARLETLLARAVEAAASGEVSPRVFSALFERVQVVRGDLSLGLEDTQSMQDNDGEDKDSGSAGEAGSMNGDDDGDDGDGVGDDGGAARAASAASAASGGDVACEEDVGRKAMGWGLGISIRVWSELRRQVSTVVANGAVVNSVMGYTALHATNVESTRLLLEFALECDSARRDARVTGNTWCAPFVFHFISSSSALHPHFCTDEESRTPPGAVGALSGYGQTKWVGEQMVRNAAELQQQQQQKSEQDAPEIAKFILCRLGMVGASVGRVHGTTGAAGEKAVSNESDWICRMVRACIELGVAPQLMAVAVPRIRLVPVDLAARMVVQCMLLTGQGADAGTRDAGARDAGAIVRTHHVMGHAQSGVLPFVDVLSSAAAYGRSSRHEQRHSADHEDRQLLVSYPQWRQLADSRASCATADPKWRQLLAICNPDGFGVAPTSVF